MPGISSSEVEVTGGSGCGSSGSGGVGWSGGATGSMPGIGTELSIGGGSVAIAALRSLSPSRVRSENRVVAVCAALMLASRSSTEASVSSTLSRAASPATTWSLDSARGLDREVDLLDAADAHHDRQARAGNHPAVGGLHRLDPDRRLVSRGVEQLRAHHGAVATRRVGDRFGQGLARGIAIGHDAHQDLGQADLGRVVEDPARDHEPVVRGLLAGVLEPVPGSLHRVALAGHEVELLPDRGVDLLVEPLP